MDPAQSVMDVLASARADQASPELVAMVGRAGLEANLMAHMAVDVARLDDQDMAERFAFHCPVPGVHADEYKTRLLELPGNGRSLVGIRFRGLDLARPFVAVVASEALPGDQDELVAAVAELGREFDRFAPTHVRVFLPSHTVLRPDRPGQFWEKRLLVGRVRDLRAGPMPVGAERLALSERSDDGWYARYETAFERLVARSREYDEYTRLESHEDRAELSEAGTLFEAWIDGEWAGL